MPEKRYSRDFETFPLVSAKLVIPRLRSSIIGAPHRSDLNLNLGDFSQHHVLGSGVSGTLSAVRDKIRNERKISPASFSSFPDTNT